MSKLNEILMKIADALKTEIDTDKLIGKEFKLGDFTCIPVLSVGVGMKKEEEPKKNLMGKTVKKEKEEKDEVHLLPVGFLVTRKESIFFVPAFTIKGLREEVEKIPDVIEKFRNIKRKKSAKV